MDILYIESTQLLNMNLRDMFCMNIHLLICIDRGHTSPVLYDLTYYPPQLLHTLVKHLSTQTPLLEADIALDCMICILPVQCFPGTFPPNMAGR